MKKGGGEMIWINRIRLHSFFKRLLFCFLVVILSVCLLINGGLIRGFQAQGFAIGITTGLAILIGAALAACGVTFLTVDDLQVGAQQVWDNLGDTTQEWLERESLGFLVLLVLLVLRSGKLGLILMLLFLSGRPKLGKIFVGP